MSLTAIAYLICYFLGLLMALQGRPLYGLIVYLLTFYMYAPGSWWGSALPSLRWSLVAALVTYLSVLLYGQKHKEIHNENKISRKTKFLNRPEFRLFAFFSVWICIQNFWAISPSNHAEFSVMAVKFFLLLFLIYKVLIDEKSVIIFVVVNLFGCGYFGWVGMTQRAGGRFEYMPTPGLGDSNLLSLHMVPILFLSSMVILCNYRLKKYLLLVPIALTLNAIFLTQSRGAIVGLLAGGFLVLLFRPIKLKPIIYFYLFLVCIAVVRLVPSDLVDRINKGVGIEETRDASADSRFVIIDAQIQMFKQAPIVGLGHAATAILSTEFIDDKYLTSLSGSRTRASHNLLMSLLVEFGLIGALPYLLIVFIFVKRLFAMRKDVLVLADGNLSIMYMGGVCALVALLVSSMFSNSLRLEVDILLFGFLGAVYRLILEQRAVRNTNSDVCASRV